MKNSDKKPTLKDRLLYYKDMEERFILFLDDATGSEIKTSDKELHVMLKALNDYQEALHYNIVKDDINNIIDKGLNDNESIVENIKKYIDKL